MLSLFSETAEEHRELFMDPVWFGILGIVGFGVLLAVTFAFRSVGNKH